MNRQQQRPPSSIHALNHRRRRAQDEDVCSRIDLSKLGFEISIPVRVSASPRAPRRRKSNSGLDGSSNHSLFSKNSSKLSFGDSSDSSSNSDESESTSEGGGSFSSCSTDNTTLQIKPKPALNSQWGETVPCNIQLDRSPIQVNRFEQQPQQPLHDSSSRLDVPCSSLDKQKVALEQEDKFDDLISNTNESVSLLDGSGVHQNYQARKNDGFNMSYCHDDLDEDEVDHIMMELGYEDVIVPSRSQLGYDEASLQSRLSVAKPINNRRSSLRRTSMCSSVSTGSSFVGQQQQQRVVNMQRRGSSHNARPQMQRRGSAYSRRSMNSGVTSVSSHYWKIDEDRELCCDDSQHDHSFHHHDQQQDTGAVSRLRRLSIKDRRGSMASSTGTASMQERRGSLVSRSSLRLPDRRGSLASTPGNSFQRLQQQLDRRGSLTSTNTPRNATFQRSDPSRSSSRSSRCQPRSRSSMSNSERSWASGRDSLSIAASAAADRAASAAKTICEMQAEKQEQEPLQQSYQDQIIQAHLRCAAKCDNEHAKEYAYRSLRKLGVDAAAIASAPVTMTPVSSSNSVNGNSGSPQSVTAFPTLHQNLTANTDSSSRRRCVAALKASRDVMFDGSNDSNYTSYTINTSVSTANSSIPRKVVSVEFAESFIRRRRQSSITNCSCAGGAMDESINDAVAAGMDESSGRRVSLDYSASTSRLPRGGSPASNADILSASQLRGKKAVVGRRASTTAIYASSSIRTMSTMASSSGSYDNIHEAASNGRHSEQDNEAVLRLTRGDSFCLTRRDSFCAHIPRPQGRRMSLSNLKHVDSIEFTAAQGIFTGRSKTSTA